MRALVPHPITHDKAGNTVGLLLLLRPGTGPSAGLDVPGTACYDAYNQLFEIEAGTNEPQRYLYDALGRRVVVMQAWGSPAVQARRFVWEDWEVISERTLQAGLWQLERVYVKGAQVDEPLFTAIDGDGDFALFTSLNQPSAPGAASTNDFEYFYLNTDLMSIGALVNAADSRKILEYYDYAVYGSTVVLPIVDAAPADGIEDTPDSLSDNVAQVLALRATDPAYGRVSHFGNRYTFTARYQDAVTGLMYFRARHYDPMTGRFLSRDPAQTPAHNLYAYGENSATNGTDPTGLGFWKKLKKKLKKLKNKVSKFFNSVSEKVSHWMGQAGRFVQSLTSALRWNSKQYLNHATRSEWKDDSGAFNWQINWHLTGGPIQKRKRKDHWVVQRILVENDIDDCAGDPHVAVMGWPDGITTYLEAWKVHFVGLYPFIVPGADGSKDTWSQDETPNSVGDLVMRGDAIWVGRNRTPYNWAHGGNRHAGSLRSTGASNDPAAIEPEWSSITGSGRRSSVDQRRRHYKWNTCS